MGFSRLSRSGAALARRVAVVGFTALAASVAFVPAARACGVDVRPISVDRDRVADLLAEAQRLEARARSLDVRAMDLEQDAQSQSLDARALRIQASSAESSGEARRLFTLAAQLEDAASVEQSQARRLRGVASQLRAQAQNDRRLAGQGARPPGWRNRGDRIRPVDTI